MQGSIFSDAVNDRGESLWTRRRVLAVGGAAALGTLTGCGPAVGRVAVQRATPWVGQFLIELGANVLGDQIGGWIDGLGGREERLASASIEIMSEGGFTADCTTEHGRLLANGVGNVYVGDNFKGVCRVDPSEPHETCIGLWANDANRSVAMLEGPVLGALHGVALSLLAENWTQAAIADAIVPRWSHALGGGLKFSTEQAFRKYRTGIGDMSVSWLRKTDWSGVAEVGLPNVGSLIVDDIPFMRPG